MLNILSQGNGFACKSFLPKIHHGQILCLVLPDAISEKLRNRG
jgi:hypothetical protein